MKRIVWFVLFLIIGVSCLDQPDCFRQDLNLIGISFRKMLDGKLDTIKSFQIYANGIKFSRDTIPGTTIQLPLDYLSKLNETNFILNIVTTTGEERTYNLSLHYKTQAQFVSVDCGQKFIISELTIPDYSPGKPPEGIDSIRLVSNAPSNPAHNNIEIYRCPRFNIIRLSFKQLFMDGDSLGKIDSRSISKITSDFVNPVVDSVSGLTTAAILTLNTQTGSTKFTFNFKDNTKAGTDSSITFKYNVTDTSYFEKKCPVKIISKLDTVGNQFKNLKIATRLVHDPPYTNAIVYKCATTNTIRVNFKKQSGSLTTAQTIILRDLKINDKSTGIKRDTTVSSLVLPLNESGNVMKFTFVTADGSSNTLQLNYTTQQFTYQKICGVQTKFSSLQIDTQNTTYTGATIVSNEVNFPTKDNVQIILP